MSKAFTIPKGRWEVPGIGRIDSSQDLSEERLFALYKVSRKVFPWISLGPDAAQFLKKQPLTIKEIVALVHNAVTVEEVELLASLNKKSKPLKNIVNTRITALSNEI